MSSTVFHLVRYLPPKTFGDGEICLSVASEGDCTLELLEGRYPDAFEREGYYILCQSTGEGMKV